jgi:hypothetical protein
MYPIFSRLNKRPVVRAIISGVIIIHLILFIRGTLGLAISQILTFILQSVDDCRNGRRSSINDCSLARSIVRTNQSFVCDSHQRSITGVIISKALTSPTAETRHKVKTLIKSQTPLIGYIDTDLIEHNYRIGNDDSKDKEIKNYTTLHY